VNATEHETEAVTGTVSGVIQKGPDKWQVAVKPDGSQYEKKLWTKDAAMQATFSALIGQTVTVQCSVSHWNNQEGKAIRSLWIASIGGNGAAPNTAPARSQEARSAPAGTDPKQDSIERQTAMKSAVEFHAGSAAAPWDVCETAARFLMFIQGREENMPQQNDPVEEIPL
jgi:hypothetical protein